MAKATQAEEAIDSIPVEELEKAIMAIGAGMRKLNNSRLTEPAILVLLRDATGLSMTTIKEVLIGMQRLERKYLLPDKPNRS